MTDIVERLKTSTEQMAHRCSVDMALWDRHSNAALDAAVEISRLRAENAALREGEKRMRDALEYIKRKAADKRNPVISFVADLALRGVDPSPLRDSAPSGKGDG